MLTGRGSPQDLRAESARGKAARAGASPSRGYRCLHHAVDDYSRLAYSEILDDEKKHTAAGFWQRAHAFFTGLGVTVEAVMTDIQAVSTGQQRGQGRVALKVQLGQRGIRTSHSRRHRQQFWRFSAAPWATTGITVAVALLVVLVFGPLHLSRTGSRITLSGTGLEAGDRNIAAGT
jgi:hypothetical protein